MGHQYTIKHSRTALLRALKANIVKILLIIQLYSWDGLSVGDHGWNAWIIYSLCLSQEEEINVGKDRFDLRRERENIATFGPNKIWVV